MVAGVCWSVGETQTYGQLMYKNARVKEALVMVGYAVFPIAILYLYISIA